jgi:DUF1365 family protein
VTAAPATTASAAAGVRHSALYVGEVRHRRHDAVGHAFAVRLYMVYLDLAELDAAFAGRWLWSHRRAFAPMRFRRADYFGDPARPLAECVRAAVGAAIGAAPDGPVRVLTQLRCLGYVFNPVTFYYCFDRAERLQAVLAEITNTPWGERHHYVVAAGAGSDGALRGEFAKAFHVSPFQPMHHRYRWAFGAPGERLGVHMENLDGGQVVFDATLAMARRPWTTGSLLRSLARHPWMTAKVTAMIYWHALRLWWKKAKFHAHPKTTSTAR